MLVYIKPKSAFPDLHSDTIFGALIYAMDQLDIDIITLLGQFKKSPPFLVSSAFPFAELDDIKVRFFPKPIMEPKKTDFDLAKKFKKVAYIEENIFKSWISGETDEKEIIEKIRHKEYDIIADKFLVSKDFDMDFKINSISLPRNTINRITQASENIFYTPLNNYDGAGLFFGIRFYDKNYKSDVEAAVKFLKDRGFGGDVSVGKGQFDFEIVDENISNNPGDLFVTLSRYIPTNEELTVFVKEQMWYEIDSKRGRSPGGKVRKQVRFFVEGSVFPDTGNEFYGRLVPSADDSVEYGYAYKIGMTEHG